MRRALLAMLLVGAAVLAGSQSAQAAGEGQPSDWGRFYNYPYVYYPQNFWTDQYYRSSGSMYFRYPPEMRVPVYNKKWYNYYPTGRLYHRGHHFKLDVF